MDKGGLVSGGLRCVEGTSERREWAKEERKGSNGSYCKGCSFATAI